MIKTINTRMQIPTEIYKNVEAQQTPSFEGKVLPVCYRCTQVPREGLYDGFRVQGMFFCSDCQKELFAAEQDSPEYQEFLFLTKAFFFEL